MSAPAPLPEPITPWSICATIEGPPGDRVVYAAVDYPSNVTISPNTFPGLQFRVIPLMREEMTTPMIHICGGGAVRMTIHAANPAPTVIAPRGSKIFIQSRWNSRYRVCYDHVATSLAGAIYAPRLKYAEHATTSAATCPPDCEVCRTNCAECQADCVDCRADRARAFAIAQIRGTARDVPRDETRDVPHDAPPPYASRA